MGSQTKGGIRDFTAAGTSRGASVSLVRTGLILGSRVCGAGQTRPGAVQSVCLNAESVSGCSCQVGVIQQVFVLSPPQVWVITQVPTQPKYTLLLTTAMDPVTWRGRK